MRVPIRTEEFERLVNKQVRGELRDSIARTHLPPARFAKEAIEARPSILDKVVTQRAVVLDLRSRLRAERLRRLSQLGSLLAGAGAIALGLPEAMFSIPGWALAAMVIVAITTLWPLILILERRQEKRKSEASSSGASKSPLSLRDQLLSAETDYREALARAIQRWVTDRANQHLGSIYSASLPEVDPKGLAEIEDSEYEITTASQDALESLIDHMPGGSIGVSGPRGVGKSTLLQRLTMRTWSEDPERVKAALMVDAPVEYDARDFVLHLFAKLCEAFLGRKRVEGMRSTERGFVGLRKRSSLPRPSIPIPPLLGPILFGTGAIVYLALLDAQGRLDPQDWEPWAVGAMVAGAVLTLGSFGGMPPLPSTLRRDLERTRNDDDLERKAEQYLRQIWYQRTFSSGWSGGLKVPLGVQIGGETSTQLAENKLSFPDVVSLYRAFAKELGRTGQVRVGIDELDKMEDDQARRFLNEIKVIFRVAGCFYFVSVSEDAMAYFERRGLPFRDVFDSSFDAISRVDYLSYNNSRQLLAQRVVGLPAQFTALAHALGGGLARDVIRTARDVCERRPGATLAEVTNDLCREQLTSKCSAARVATRRLQDPVKIVLLSEWLRTVEMGASDLHALLERCQHAEKEFIAPLGPPPGDADKLREYREALSVGMEVITFAYFVATLRGLMATLDTPESARGVIHDGSIDRLAKAKQAFASNPAEAWAAISGVRRPGGTWKSVAFPGSPRRRASRANAAWRHRADWRP